MQRICISPNLTVAFDRILFLVVAELPYTDAMLTYKSVRDVGPIRPDSGISGSGCAGAWVERDRSGGRGAQHAGVQAADTDAFMVWEATSTL